MTATTLFFSLLQYVNTVVVHVHIPRGGELLHVPAYERERSVPARH